MFYCNTIYGSSENFFCENNFAEHTCWIKNPCCKKLASPCTDYFHQNHPSSTERVHASYVPQSAISYQLSAFFLSHSTSIFSHVFLFPSTVLSLFCLFSITCGMFVCLYKLRLLPPDFMMHLLLCLLYLLGCICTALMVHLLCLSRKLFLTAVIPDGFLSIFLQLLKKLYFLKPYEFSLRVLT